LLVLFALAHRLFAAFRDEEERKKQGLPPRVVGSILPHSAVAHAEERWEAEQERKKKHAKPRKSGSKVKNFAQEKGHD